MAKASFETALLLVLKHEGGYVDDPRDPGGATKLGVTIGTLSQWLGRAATKKEVRALTDATVAPIYRARYWDEIRGDDLASGLDYCVFDFCVNSGVTRASMALQRAVGVADDGKLGPISLAAAAKVDTPTLISRICTARLAFMTHLTTWPVYGKGWRSRVQGVEKVALKMCLT